MRRRKVFYVWSMVFNERNLVLQGQHNRPFLADVHYLRNRLRKPVIVFSHGFKGFKDWGAYDLMAEHFAEAGFIFVKFNFSHNGTTIDSPVDFADLEAFGNDNFSIEMDDLGVVIDFVSSNKFPISGPEVDRDNIYLLGHSRGGGISILKAREDKRVKKLCTWGSVNEFGKYWDRNELERIKQNGVIFVPNARTKQMMPVRWQMYEDYFAHLDRLYIPDAVRALQIPFLIIHGSKDETVPVSAASEMHSWSSQTELLLLENGNHNFGGKHPWIENYLPEDMRSAVRATIEFYKR